MRTVAGIRTVRDAPDQARSRRHLGKFNAQLIGYLSDDVIDVSGREDRRCNAPIPINDFAGKASLTLSLANQNAIDRFPACVGSGHDDTPLV